MQEMKEAAIVKKCPSAHKQALQAAACTLREGESLITLVLTYLFCVLSLFALSFVIAALGFFAVPLTLLGALLLALVRIGVAVIASVTLLLPLFAGRARMAGMVAAGKEVSAAELFHYFGSWRLWWRGVRIGLLMPLALLIPPFFSVPAFAMGNEDMSLRRAIFLSVGRVPLLCVLAFWGRVLVRLLLGLLTLGLLWLFYDAHHAAVAYFTMAMQEPNEQTEDFG